MLKKSLLILSLMFASVAANAGIIEAFQPTDTDGNNDSSGALLFVEYGGALNPDISYNWYLTDTNTNTVVDTMNIFSGSDGWLSGSTIAWDFLGGTATASNGNVLDFSGYQAGWELGASFDYKGDTIYSHDALNGGLDLVDINVIDFAGFDLSMGFHDDNGTTGKWYSGFDDYGQIVKVSDVQPWDINTPFTVTEVPEPAMAGLFALGAAGMVLSRRRKSAKVTSA